MEAIASRLEAITIRLQAIGGHSLLPSEPPKNPGDVGLRLGEEIFPSKAAMKHPFAWPFWVASPVALRCFFFAAPRALSFLSHPVICKKGSDFLEAFSVLAPSTCGQPWYCTLAIGVVERACV